MSNRSSMYRDSRWQKKRLEIMERDNWTCRSCGKGKDDEITLNVHHAYYESGKKPWEYDNDMLVTWCESCHEERHHLMRNLQISLLGADSVIADTVIGIAESLLRPGMKTMVDSFSTMLDVMHCDFGYYHYVNGRRSVQKEKGLPDD